MRSQQHHHSSSSSFPTPVVHIKSSSSVAKKKTKKGSLLRSILEITLFVAWLICTGVAGYFMGYDPSTIQCPELQPIAKHQPIKRENNCAEDKLKSGDQQSTMVKNGGFTIDELKTMWQCSHAEASDDEVHKQILPDDNSLGKTKWKSIITVEPKKFFNKYLSQYPSDTRAVQPVVVFSHKPLKHFDELSDVCKVIDIAIVPDKPGVCVAVTETYHDVASYHMLHADRQSDGSFALTSNSIPGRSLPKEPAYAAARALLLDFFKYGEEVNKAVKVIPKFNNGRVVIGCIIEDQSDAELFLNSLASAAKPGISRSKFAVFTTSQQVDADLKNTKVKVVYMPYLRDVGTIGDANVGAKLRYHFLQVWLAFAVANSLIKITWASPGTIWYERPDNIVNAYPAVETLWMYKGRRDQRSAPFFVSFDLFTAVGQERVVHLLHELVTHFDLVIAWDSLDAVASYRLSENNSR